MKEKLREIKGITLIALVITIIVLLILAGVSIAMLTGENGILTQAQKASEETNETKDLEQVKLAVSSGVSENLTKGTNVNTAIQNELRRTDELAAVTGENDEKTIIYNQKTYYVNIKTGEAGLLTEDIIEARKSIKIIVNSGDDGFVILPFNESSGTVEEINWGDGSVITGRNNGLLKQTKLASLNSIKIAPMLVVPGLYYHTYEEKNKEFEVEIKGDIVNITSEACNYYLDENTGGNIAYNEGCSKILEITQWGETGLRFVLLKDCENLRKIASPSRNSFKNANSFNFSGTAIREIPGDLFSNCAWVQFFSETFEYCENLESIPRNLFDNCEGVESFARTFRGCSNLKGDPIPLWERIEGYEELNPNNEEEWMDKDPSGEACYSGCYNLNNYSDIPSWWR